MQSDLTDVGCMMRLRLISFEIVDGSFPIFSAMERKVSCWLIPVWISIRSSRVRCFCFFIMRYLLTKSLRLNSSLIRRLRVTSSFGREMEVTLRSYEIFTSTIKPLHRLDFSFQNVYNKGTKFSVVLTINPLVVRRTFYLIFNDQIITLKV